MGLGSFMAQTWENDVDERIDWSEALPGGVIVIENCAIGLLLMCSLLTRMRLIALFKRCGTLLSFSHK